MRDEETIRALPQEIDPQRITEVIRLTPGVGSSSGETLLLQLDGAAWRVFARDGEDRPLQEVQLDEAGPADFHRVGDGGQLLLNAADGTRAQLDVPADHCDRVEQIVEQAKGYATEATRGMLWTSLASLAARGLGFAVTMVLTHLMSREALGTANAAFTVAITLGFFAVPGFPSELLRRKRRFDEAATLATWSTTALWLALALGAFLAAEPIARLFDTTATYLRVALAIPTVIVPLLLPDVLLNRRLQFGRLSLLDVGASAGNAITAIGLALAGLGGMAVVLGQLVREAVIHFVGLLLTGLGWLRRPRWDGPLMREMLAFGLPVMLSNVLEFAAQNWDNLFIAHTFGSQALGSYAVAYTLAYTPVYTVTSRVSGVVFATVARFADDEPRRRDAIVRALSAIMMLLGAAVVLTMLDGPRVVALLIDARWTAAVSTLVVALALVGVGLPLQFLPDYYFQAIGQPKATVVVMLLKVALMFAALYFFGRSSVEAAAWAVSGSFVVAGVMACALLRLVDQIPLARVLVALVPATVGCALMAATIWGLRQLLPWGGNLLPLLLEVSCGCAVYLGYQLLFHRERVRDIVSSLLGR